MSQHRVFLFGRFCVRRDGEAVAGFEVHKVQQLLSYLLLYRDRVHPRESIAGLLWGETSTAQSRKYLRKTLWQLLTALDQPTSFAESLLAVEPHWIRLNSHPHLWVDVAEFESTFKRVQGIPGQQLDDEDAALLQAGVDLYSGNLLEGWYQDWCLFERERLQDMYLLMLDKLMSYCEARRLDEIGVIYGAKILQLDHARERTYRQLIRLYYLAGDRSAALRQYARCKAALKEDLGVEPDRETHALYERVRAGVPLPPSDGPGQGGLGSAAESMSEAWPLRNLPEALGNLWRLREILDYIQNQVHEGIKTIESAMSKQR
jgi:DNA-binding SARP family transcriptional activator